MTLADRFISAVVPPAERSQPAWRFVFQESRLLVRIDDRQAVVPLQPDWQTLELVAEQEHYLGLFDDRPCFAVAVGPDQAAPEGWQFQGLRRLMGMLPEPLFWLAGRAIQIVAWDINHRFCGRCAEPTVIKAQERARECPACGLISYPRISPAIIVLIERDNTILLARSHRHPTGRFSVLAGFVEPGETLEETVSREVREEVGVAVKDIRYFGSQPWPFPDSLMLAFTCTYVGGEIVLQEAEMIEAGWFTADALPAVPPPPTISRALIDWFVARHQADPQQTPSW